MKTNEYDAERGISVPTPEPVSVRQICGILGIDASQVAFAAVDSVMVRDLDAILPNAAEIGLFSQPPAGG